MTGLQKGIRYGLTAATIVMFAGALHGCASDSPTEPTVDKQPDATPTCYWVNGIWFCKN